MEARQSPGPSTEKPSCDNKLKGLGAELFPYERGKVRKAASTLRRFAEAEYLLRTAAQGRSTAAGTSLPAFDSPSTTKPLHALPTPLLCFLGLRISPLSHIELRQYRAESVRRKKPVS